MVIQIPHNIGRHGRGHQSVHYIASAMNKKTEGRPMIIQMPETFGRIKTGFCIQWSDMQQLYICQTFI
jgi:hypothetical protein